MMAVDATAAATQAMTKPLPSLHGSCGQAAWGMGDAFERFFGMPAPASLAEVSNLTPGDFAVVARQLRWTGKASATELVERLRIEAACKPGDGGRIGF